MRYSKTRAVAKLIGRTYAELYNLTSYQKIPLPEKDDSGDYIWAPEDIARAREFFAARDRRKQEKNHVSC